VHPHRIDIGAVQQGLVRAWVIGADTLDQFVLAKVLRARLGDGGGLGPCFRGFRR